MPTPIDKGGRPRHPKRAQVVRAYQMLRGGIAGHSILVTRAEYRYSRAQVAAKYGVTEAQVSLWAKQAGFSRYRRNG